MGTNQEQVVTTETMTEEVAPHQETEQTITETPTEVPISVIETTAQKIPTANIKASRRFGEKYNRDLMAALLKEDSYTIDEAEKILNDFMGVK